MPGHSSHVKRRGSVPSSLTTAETLIGFMPISLLLAVFFSVKAKPEYGFTESGRRYRKVEVAERLPLLATRGFWLVFGLLMGGAALWALAEAAVSAVQQGTVSLPGVRRYPRPSVSWLAAWAYLSGTSFIALSMVLPRFVGRESRARFWLQLGAAFLGTSGYLLVLLSPIFSSLAGVAIFFTAVGVVAAVFYLRRQSVRRTARDEV